MIENINTWPGKSSDGLGTILHKLLGGKIARTLAYFALKQELLNFIEQQYLKLIYGSSAISLPNVTQKYWCDQATKLKHCLVSLWNTATTETETTQVGNIKLIICALKPLHQNSGLPELLFLFFYYFFLICCKNENYLNI